MKGTVDHLGGSGDGVVDLPGERWYVPLAAPGDEIEFERQKGQGKGGPNRGRLTRIVQPGPERHAALCPHFGRCGGCALQHLDHTFTTNWKLDAVRGALSRRGFDNVPLSIGVEGAPGRRRRAAMTSVRPGGDLPVLGFHERRGRNVVAAKQCPVLETELEALLTPLRTVLADVQQPRSEMRVCLNLTDGGIDILLDGGLEGGLRAHEALTGFGEAHNIARLSVASGGEPWTVLERHPPRLDWQPLTVTPPPGAFLQADRHAEAYMRAMVSDWSDASAASLDLFCGVGTLVSALPLAATTMAIDSDPAAVNALRAGLDRSQIDVRTEVRNLFRRPLQSQELARFEQAVLDPPAAGAKEQCAELAKSDLERVIYVSCSPATFARDARLLAEGGFRLQEVRMIDQFYWSAEVELAALFSRT